MKGQQVGFVLALTAIVALGCDPTETSNVSGFIPAPEPAAPVTFGASQQHEVVGHGTFPQAIPFKNGIGQIWWHAQNTEIADPSFVLKLFTDEGHAEAVVPDHNLNFLAMAGGDHPWMVSVDAGPDFSGPGVTKLQRLDAPAGEMSNTFNQVADSFSFRTNGDFLVFSQREVMRSLNEVRIESPLTSLLPLAVTERLRGLGNVLNPVLAIRETYNICDLSAEMPQGCVMKTSLGSSDELFGAEPLFAFMPVAARDATGNVAVAFSVFTQNGQAPQAWIVFRTAQGAVTSRRLTGFDLSLGQEIKAVVPTFEGFAVLGTDDWAPNAQGTLLTYSPNGERLERKNLDVTLGIATSLVAIEGSLVVAHGEQGTPGASLSSHDAVSLELIQVIALEGLSELVSSPTLSLWGDGILVQTNDMCEINCASALDFDISNVTLLVAD